ncbi:MAG: helix-hairpin-helix domain-containing protein [Oscillospiraceae bacterium]|jgi:competence protein ComEA|nr:helix-hairpin-helix domain-containing protein [Oscillospiraceae bacterium]
MRTRRAELAVIIITVAFVFFAGGFFVGRLGAPGGITPAPVPDAAADAPPGGETAPAHTPDAPPPSASPSDAPPPAEPPPADLEHDSQGRVNINTASAQTLQELRGIGPAISERIVAYRDKNGPFASIEDILNVAGIGDAKFSDIKEDVTVG